MKKENRKKAQELRAKARAREARIKKLKVIIPIVALVVIIAAIAAYQLLQSDEEGESVATTSTSESVTTTSTSESVETTSESSDGTTLNTTEGTVVEDGDTVNIDYVGSIDGVEFDGGSTEGAGTDLTLGSGLYIDGFEDAIVGHTVGESFDIEVTFPEDYASTDLAGQDATFAITINGVYE